MSFAKQLRVVALMTLGVGLGYVLGRIIFAGLIAITHGGAS